MSTIKIRTGQLRQLVKEAMTRDDLAIGGFAPEPPNDGAGDWMDELIEEVDSAQDEYTDEEILAKLDQLMPDIIEQFAETGRYSERLTNLMWQAMGQTPTWKSWQSTPRS
jgi:hypothetical protein